MSHEPLPLDDVVFRLFELGGRWAKQEFPTIPFTADDYDTVVAAREWLLALARPVEINISLNKDRKAPTQDEVRAAMLQFIEDYRKRKL